MEILCSFRSVLEGKTGKERDTWEEYWIILPNFKKIDVMDSKKKEA